MKSRVLGDAPILSSCNIHLHTIILTRYDLKKWEEVKMKSRILEICFYTASCHYIIHTIR